MTTLISAGISEALAFEMEEVEKNAWCDMYRAAPEAYAKDMKIFQLETQDMNLLAASLPMGLFNRVFMHGLKRPVTERDIDNIIEFFSVQGSTHYHIYATPFSRPGNFIEMMEAKGLKMVAATDKIYCLLQEVELPSIGHTDVSLVDDVNEWAEFICSTYGGLPNQPWLAALVERKGWFHAVAKLNGKIIACRSLYIDEANRGWLGIDAPIPGVMTNNFEPDYYLSAYLLQLAKAKGVYLVNSCVEALNNADAHAYWHKLGFEVAYRRRNFML